MNRWHKAVRPNIGQIILCNLCLTLFACESKPKLTMAPEEIISALRDYADRGCACGTDKECFREIRDEWDAAKRPLVRNANLLTGAERDAYLEERNRFGACGDAAGLTVWDNV